MEINCQYHILLAMTMNVVIPGPPKKTPCLQRTLLVLVLRWPTSLLGIFTRGIFEVGACYRGGTPQVQANGCESFLYHIWGGGGGSLATPRA